MPVLSMTLAGISFPSCLINASGAWSGTHQELRELAASATGAVVMKTTTTQARVEEVQGCGIENPGQPYYLDVVAELRSAGKPLIGSIAGFTTLPMPPGVSHPSLPLCLPVDHPLVVPHIAHMVSPNSCWK